MKSAVLHKIWGFPTLTGLIFLAFLFIQCQPPVQGGQQVPQVKPEVVQEVIGVLEETAVEFQELAKPNQVKAWVDNLIVKAQPGKEMKTVTRMKEGEIATYLYQRTVRKESHKLRNQTYNESWLLIQTKDSLVGWVHGGGVIFVQPDFTEYFTQTQNTPAAGDPLAPQATQRTRSPQAAPAKLTPEQIREREKVDFLIEPGSRIGPIHANTSEDALIRMYGPGITRGEVTTTGDKKENCTILMEGTYDELRITWNDDLRTQVKAVYMLKENGKWHTKEGLRPGLSMLDLTKINKAPISFYGFGWEYSGTVESYRKGVLAPKKKFFYLVLGPQYPSSVSQHIKKFSGNRIFTSTTDGIDALSLKVDRMVVYLD